MRSDCCLIISQVKRSSSFPWSQKVTPELAVHAAANTHSSSQAAPTARLRSLRSSVMTFAGPSSFVTAAHVYFTTLHSIDLHSLHCFHSQPTLMLNVFLVDRSHMPSYQLGITNRFHRMLIQSIPFISISFISACFSPHAALVVRAFVSFVGFVLS